MRVPGTSSLNLLPFIATPFYPMCSNINLKSGIIKAVDDEPVDPKGLLMECPRGTWKLESIQLVGKSGIEDNQTKCTIVTNKYRLFPLKITEDCEFRIKRKRPEFKLVAIVLHRKRIYY